MTSFAGLSSRELDQLRQWEACREWFLGLTPAAQAAATECPPIGRYFLREHGPDGGFYLVDGYSNDGSLNMDRFLPDGTFLHTVVGVTADEFVLYDSSRGWDYDCRIPGEEEHKILMAQARSIIKANRAGLN